MNVEIAGHTVDALWRDRGLAVEIDSWRFHGTRTPFEDDRVRDADLLLAGVRTLGVIDRRLETEPERVMASVGRLLTI